MLDFWISDEAGGRLCWQSVESVYHGLLFAAVLFKLVMARRSLVGHPLFPNDEPEILGINSQRPIPEYRHVWMFLGAIVRFSKSKVYVMNAPTIKIEKRNSETFISCVVYVQLAIGMGRIKPTSTFLCC